MTLRDLVVDFETFYDPKEGYSLKSMPSMQYIRDDRFRVLGVAVAHSMGVCYLQDGKQDECTASTDFSDVNVIAHNCSFDAAVLYNHYGKRASCSEG